MEGHTMSFLNAATPDELRAAVSASIDPLASLGIDYDLQAMTEAKTFIAGRTEANWLHDVLENEPFISDAMRIATSGDNFTSEPEPGRAILVLSSGLDMHRFGERAWVYIRDVESHGIEQADDNLPCHRCTVARIAEDRAGDIEPVRIAGVFHIARGCYVVEVALCSDCIRYFEAQADHVRIHSGDTYIEDPLEG